MARIVLIGAGSKKFGYDTMGDIFARPTLAGSHVVLHDINGEVLNQVLATGQQFIRDHKLDIQLSATTNRKEALKGANFIVVSIEVGDRIKMWDQDRQIPQQFGIRQVYGENGGPGGLFHSLRVIPPILEICADIEAICPEAFIFNFSNPMSRICTTVHRSFPSLKFYGLCHESASLRRYLPPLLGIPFERLEFVAAGLNHFSCLLEAKDKKDGRDLYPEIRRKGVEFFRKVPGCADYIADGFRTGKRADSAETPEYNPAGLQSEFEWCERRMFKFVLEHFDLLPITVDSHLAEYVPWAHEVADHRAILDFLRYYRMYLGAAKHEIKLQSQERVISMIEAIITDKELYEIAVNMPNDGYISELPEWIAVEVPATVRRSGIEGQKISTLPPAYAALLQNQIAIHQMTAEAVLSRSKKTVVQALLVDPIVDRAACLGELVDVMVDAQREYLGYLK